MRLGCWLWLAAMVTEHSRGNWRRRIWWDMAAQRQDRFCQSFGEWCRCICHVRCCQEASADFFHTRPVGIVVARGERDERGVTRETACDRLPRSAAGASTICLSKEASCLGVPEVESCAVHQEEEHRDARNVVPVETLGGQEACSLHVTFIDATH